MFLNLIVQNAVLSCISHQFFETLRDYILLVNILLCTRTWNIKNRKYENVITYSMVQDILWNVDSYSACQRISCFLYGTRRFITVFKRTRHWFRTWAIWIQTITSHSVPPRSSLILFSHLRLGLLNDLFLWSLPTTVLYKSIIPVRATLPAHLFLLYLIAINLWGGEYIYWNSLLILSSALLLHASWLQIPSLCSQTPSVHVHSSEWVIKLQIHPKQDKIWMLCF